MIIIIKNKKKKLNIIFKKNKILFILNFKNKNLINIKNELFKIKNFCEKKYILKYKYNGVSKKIIDYILSWKIS